MRQLSVSERLEIQRLHKEKFSDRYIAKKINCSRDTVHRWTRLCPVSTNKVEEKRGRKRKFNLLEEKQIEKILVTNNRLGTRQLVSKVKAETRKSISDRTLRYFARSWDYKWGQAKPRPELSEKTKRKRFLWCKKHENEDWKKWIFSDEKFFRLGTISKKLRYKKGSQPEITAKRYGPSFHVWNAIHYKEQFPIIMVPKKMNSSKYQEILRIGFQGHYQKGMIFQQDNAPSHRAKDTLLWLEINKIKVCRDFPPYSPDLNPIENFWGISNQKLGTFGTQTNQDFSETVKKQLQEFPRKIIKNLILSMSKRVKECIKLKGGHVNY
jgi:transposase